MTHEFKCRKCYNDMNGLPYYDGMCETCFNRIHDDEFTDEVKDAVKSLKAGR